MRRTRTDLSRVRSESKLDEAEKNRVKYDRSVQELSRLGIESNKIEASENRVKNSVRRSF